MRSILKIMLLLISLLLLNNCAGVYQPKTVFSPEQKLARQIDMQLSSPALETALSGIMVQSAETGEILYQHNANTLMMPASNEKIPTSAAALVRLGPDFRYETKIYATGTIENGVLNGDLIVVGSGDPTLSRRFLKQPDQQYIFEAWADSLHARGIDSINGNIIGSDDVFDDQFIGYGWTVNNLSYAYCAQIGGLIYNENMAQLVIQADSSGDFIRIDVSPDLGYLKIEPDLEIDPTETDIFVERILETNQVRIEGKIQPGRRYVENIATHNPTYYFLNGLKQELLFSGINSYGQLLDADDISNRENLAAKQLLFTHFSPRFEEVLTVLLKKSQNLYAETMVKLLGHLFGKEGSFQEGAKIVKETLRRFGLEEDSYSFMDGSGLCRYNYISPAHLVTILRNMYYHRYGQIYRNALPIAGVDGTIDYRLKRTVAEGKINAKTGTISNVRCLSGYATTKDGETLIFSTMFNNFLCSTSVVMDVQDRICMLLTSFSRKSGN